MTQEEKARAYDEALERAKKFEEKYGGGYAAYIFPELQDEDERIRKWLVNYFETISKNWLHDQVMPLNSILAYLEKQKEQKPVDFPATDEEMKDFLDKTPPVEVPEKYKTADWLFEKQKAPENTSASTMIPSCHEELTEFELVLFNAVLDNNFVGAKGSENALAMAKKIAPELLALAKNELLSRADERRQWVNEKCNQLKSLKPQSHWKPSEEKLSAFASYIEELSARAKADVGGWEKYDALINLYEDLKKLNEDNLCR